MTPAAIAEAILELPASSSIEAEATKLAAATRKIAASGDEKAALIESIARCLEGCAAGTVAIHEAVPYLASALEEIDAKERPGWQTAVAGARYEIETLLPGAVRPDVAVDRLRGKK